MKKITHIDCTLRDGGYYNNWDFSREIIAAYLPAMSAAAVDVVEIGFRSFLVDEYRGACAYATDSFLRRLIIPKGIALGVMVNAVELIRHECGPVGAAQLLFSSRNESPVEVVRIACHVHEVNQVMPACSWLASVGYRVGLNLMQVADRTDEEIETVAGHVDGTCVEVLYFADSLGSLDTDQTANIVEVLRRRWSGALGIHTHDNMGRALANTLRAMEEGVSWVDSTVTGMGRGAGNAQTEYLVIELEQLSKRRVNLTPLLELISKYFSPMQVRYRWGKNPFYYLAGQLGIHPTFVQEMLADARYEESDILAVIDHLRVVGGKKFSESLLEEGRQFYRDVTVGEWRPAEVLEGKEVLIIGSGPSAREHQESLEQYIRDHHPFVIALNAQVVVDQELIDVRAVCHPVRLLADGETYLTLPQPLVVPRSRLSVAMRDLLSRRRLLDFGLTVRSMTFQFNETWAIVPSPLVIAYALAISTSGRARRILLAGFDGYCAGDPRNAELNKLVSLYRSASGARPLLSITPSVYDIPTTSLYAL